MKRNTPPTVALLEARMSHELGRLVMRHGGVPLSVPSVREASVLGTKETVALLDELSLTQDACLVLLTGVAVTHLFEAAEAVHRRAELVTTLRRLTTVCRGPKPVAALRGFGVVPTMLAREPFTTAELVDALSPLDLRRRPVFLLHYGERNHTLAETLSAQGATLREVWLYTWELPEDTKPLSDLVDRVLAGTIDAIAITCQVQFRHLLEVAKRRNLERELVEALNDHVLVGAIGPVCRAMLLAHGVRVGVMPEHPKMGPLVLAMMNRLGRPPARAVV